MAIEISFFNAEGKKDKNVLLDIDLKKKKESPLTFALVLRKLFQNWRQGTVACKSRGEVSFSKKKPWRQKGTGRARAGTLRSPLWRKGGIIFGPRPRVRMLDINKKQNRLALNNLFMERLASNKIFCVDFDLGQENKPNTKKAMQLINSLGLGNKKIVLFLPFDDELSFASFRNIDNVLVLSFDQPNVFSLANGQYWVFWNRDLDLFKEMVLKWN